MKESTRKRQTIGPRTIRFLTIFPRFQYYYREESGVFIGNTLEPLYISIFVATLLLHNHNISGFDSESLGDTPTTLVISALKSIRK